MINKKLFDAIIKNQIATGRYANQQVQSIIKLLNAADKEIIAKIINQDFSRNVTAKSLNALLKDIRETIDAAYWEAEKQLHAEMGGFAIHSGEVAQDIIATQLPVAFSVSGLTDKQLLAIIDKTPITVGPDKKLLLEEIFTSLAAGKEESIRGAIRLGVVEGESTAQMVTRLAGTKANQYKDGVFEVSRRNAETIVRTAVNHTSNQALQSTYKANSDVLNGWIFTATLDQRTSITCASLAGTKWKMGEGPIPPRHPNCRSVQLPDIRSFRELGIDMDEMPPSMRSSKDGLVRSDISFQDWLSGQSEKTQIDILGKTRSELFNAGKLDITSFTDDKGRVLSLDQLKQSHAASFKKILAK